MLLALRLECVMVSKVLELLGKASVDMWSEPENAGIFQPTRASAIADQICTPEVALMIMNEAFSKDQDYARSWHDNLSMAFQDAGCERTIAQDGASRFMKLAFGVEINARRTLGATSSNSPGTPTGTGVQA